MDQKTKKTKKLLLYCVAAETGSTFLKLTVSNSQNNIFFIIPQISKQTGKYRLDFRLCTNQKCVNVVII